MSRILMAFLLLFACLTPLPAQTPPKIKVLILTGVSNHGWRATTPLLREILERTGKFDVHVNEEVRGNTLQTFALRCSAAQLQRLEEFGPLVGRGRAPGDARLC